jgi:anthranilate/para-aminobenzoate synthase component I
MTVSELPEPAVLEAIERYEEQPRRLYGGAVLTAHVDGSLDEAAALRSVFRLSGPGGPVLTVGQPTADQSGARNARR